MDPYKRSVQKWKSEWKGIFFCTTAYNSSKMIFQTPAVVDSVTIQAWSELAF